MSLIVPAGTMIFEPAGAVAIAWRSDPGPESVSFVTWMVAAAAADGVPPSPSAPARAASPNTPRLCVKCRGRRIGRGT